MVMRKSTFEKIELFPGLKLLFENLLESKKGLDLPLFEGKISKEDYVTKLNDIVRQFLRRAEKLVPVDDYMKMFGIKPGAEIPDIASVDDVSDLENYNEISRRFNPFDWRKRKAKLWSNDSGEE